MNSIKREEDTSFGAAESDQSTRPDVSEDTVMKQMWAGTPVAPSLSDTGEYSGTSALQSDAHEQEAALKILKPNPSNGEKRYFTFNFHKSSKQSDWSELTAYGELHENIYSALRANEDFSTRLQDRCNKNIIVYEEKTMKGYINLGMPLKCLPPDSHCTVTVGRNISDQKEANQILRQCENPDIDYILFHVVAVGKTTKKITKLGELHEHGRTLCIYASKDETVQEALCKDGRFRSDLEELQWKLREDHKKVYGKEILVEAVAGKVLELDIPTKRSVGKGTRKKTNQENDDATDGVCPRARMQAEVQTHEPGEDGETEDVEHDRDKLLAPRSRGHDIKGKTPRTMARMTDSYDDSDHICEEDIKLSSRCRQRPHLGMCYVTEWDLGKEAADLWLKNIQILGIGIMQQYPNFSKEAIQMKKYFQEERREENLSSLEQFNIYKEYFEKVTSTSTSIATYEHLTQLSMSVGFIIWEHNGRRVNGTCFVFNEGYIFTCRHIIQFMLGEGKDLRLWPDISEYVRVNFTYKGSCPPAADWFSVEQWIQVSDDNLDYAILKLRDHRNGFPPGLVGNISSPPSDGLVYIIGHPEGQNKKLDNCAVIPLQKRLEKYPEQHRQELKERYAAILNACPMFTQRSFLRELWSSDTLSYNTCFSDGSSGSPVFSASGKLVAMHTVGHYNGSDNPLIEFGYSMQAILCDIEQKKRERV